jgi:hypothetical protein
VVEGMVRRLEAEERRAQSDAATARLMLLSVVRKVRAWEGAPLGICLRVCMQWRCYSACTTLKKCKCIGA